VPASDTGAVEMALWSLLGARPVDMLTWESFGEGWVTDVAKQLKLKGARVLKAPYGQIADLKAVDWTHDVVFTWNGTTSGVKVPNGDWIAADREGLAICDATSAVFAMDLPWQKLDVVTWSWQKVMGGEGAHGMLVLSPRAIQRLESYTPAWPMPKIFRLTSGGKFSEAIFKGDTINTPSLLCVEDAIDGLRWGESVGGLKGLMARSVANLGVLEKFVAARPWAAFLAADKAIRSNTSVCLVIEAPWFTGLAADKQAAAAKKMADLLETEKAGYDVGSYRDAPSVCASGAAPRWRRATSRRCCPGWTGLMARSSANSAKRRPEERLTWRSPRYSSPMSCLPVPSRFSPSAAATSISKPGLKPAELRAIIGNYEGLAIRSATKVTAEVLAEAKKLKVVGRAGIGVDNVDIKAATAHGVVVMNTPFGNAITTAEHAIALMFAVARQVPDANTSTQAGKWEKNRFMGVELSFKTLGLIGCGNIGSIVAERALGLKMRVLAYDPFLSDQRAAELGVEKARSTRCWRAPISSPCTRRSPSRPRIS